MSNRQKGNPLLRHITNVAWHYDAKLKADYDMGGGACALYLSLKYHLLHPKYAEERRRWWQEETARRQPDIEETVTNLMCY